MKELRVPGATSASGCRLWSLSKSKVDGGKDTASHQWPIGSAINDSRHQLYLWVQLCEACGNTMDAHHSGSSRNHHVSLLPCGYFAVRRCGQTATTIEAGQCPLLTRYGHRISQRIFQASLRSGHPSHHDSRKLPPVIRPDIPESHQTRDIMCRYLCRCQAGGGRKET